MILLLSEQLFLENFEVISEYEMQDIHTIVFLLYKKNLSLVCHSSI